MSNAKKLHEMLLETSQDKPDPEHFHPKLNIDKRNRLLLITGTILGFAAILAILIVTNLIIAIPKAIAFFLIFGIGMMIVLLPISETWVYRPWQSVAQKYEKTFFFHV